MSELKLPPPFPASIANASLAAKQPAALHPSGLPLVFLDDDERLYHSTSAVPQCLTQELSIDRLNTLHRHIWWAGRPTPARPLHRQAMLGRSLVPTNQARYHLLWRRQKIFVKPLPGYLLDYGFWEKELCGDKRLHKLACGFLLSWVWLVRSEVDFGIARKNDLIPEGLEWRDWCALVKALTLSLNNTGEINIRYSYGELRINRLNQICRFIAPTSFHDIIKGYYSGYLTYDNFFKENFAWLFTVFAFVSVLLSAFQVGADVEKLKSDSVFQNFTYSVAMSSIVSPFLLAFFSILLFLALFSYHLIQTIMYQKERKRLRENWNSCSE